MMDQLNFLGNQEELEFTQKKSKAVWPVKPRSTIRMQMG